jgi:hypothetical protein
MGLGKDGYLFAGDIAESRADMWMCAVLIGGIPEGDALIVAGAEQVGQTLYAQLPWRDG